MRMISVDIPKNIKSNLKDLGFTDYETSIYITLLITGPLNAKELSKASKVPYSRIYQVIQELNNKEFITKDKDSRPTLFYGAPPLDALKSARKRYYKEFDRKTKFLFDELNPMYLMKNAPQRLEIYQIEGKKYCINKMQKLTRRAKNDVLLATSNTDILKSIYPILKELRLKGISNIHLLIQSGQFEKNFRKSELFDSIKKIAQIKKTEKVFGTLIVIDGGLDAFMIYEKSLVDECIISGIFSEAPLLGIILFQYFQYLYDGAKIIHSSKTKKNVARVNIV
ncbi:MAG: hypothetical protein GF364_06880 [Candidatus Lokiarchaeota archaeon]|nr:hypothetical protein [Candidatus Lokiarchaeota archaeon]